MPVQTLSTLLRRATRKRLLKRDSGRYRRGPVFPSVPNVSIEKERIEVSQKRLAEALMSHAGRRNLELPSSDAAMELLFRFLEDEQISLLLGAPTKIVEGTDPTLRERAVVAEFVQDAIREDAAFRATLNDILQGLVLYRAAFLPDLVEQNRQFRNLKAFVDSGLVRQALGYEGTAMRTLLRETIDVLKAAGLRTLTAVSKCRAQPGTPPPASPQYPQPHPHPAPARSRRPRPRRRESSAGDGSPSRGRGRRRRDGCAARDSRLPGRVPRQSRRRPGEATGTSSGVTAAKIHVHDGPSFVVVWDDV